ncbi:cytosine permease [Arthrobacter sp. NyZ413]|uniref:cytosine permease n=1 Tax=Arthrobacter sp. NyZ413 TaxID=3144669 RepID=UPI003BF81A32
MTDTSPGTAAAESGLPLLPAERKWGSLALFGNAASAAVATWCFIIGGLVSNYLPAGIGTLVMIAGMLIGMFFVIMACLPSATRYGLEAIRSTRPILGVRGSLFTVALLITFTLGWNAILVIFLGRAGAQIFVNSGLAGESTRGFLEVALAVGGLFIVWLTLLKGPETLRNVGPIIAGSVIVLSVVVMVLLFTKLGADAIFTAPALAPSGDNLLDYMTGIELLISTGLSWWPYVGGVLRNSAGTHTAIWPAISGLGVAVSAICLIGLYSSTAIPESKGDPTKFLMEVGGLGFGLLALAFIVLANIGTAMLGIYVSALALKQIPAFDRIVPWNVTTASVLAPVGVIVALFATPFYDHFGTFLSFSGVVFGPLCGVQIVDYFLIRKQQLHLRSLFTDEPGNRYWFTGGFNLSGLVSIGAGVCAYLLLLDPVTFASAPAFKYIGASVPATVVAAGFYLILRKWVFRSPEEPATGRLARQGKSARSVRTAV